MAGCIISIRPTYSCAAYLLIYLRSWLGQYKTGNCALILFIQTLALYKSFTYLLTYICETVEDIAKVTINGLHKVVHWLWITAKMYDLE